MESYFENSMFIKGIKYPVGGNIAPKSDASNKNYNVSIINNSNIEIVKIADIENGKDIFGKFESEEIKKTNLKNSNYEFKLIDKGYFVSTIIMEENEITINTISNIKRNTEGVNFDDICFRDGMFPDVIHNDVNHVLNITEHFKLLKDKKRLIHYSEQSNFFEVFNVSSNFNLLEGISKLNSPELFDDLYYNNIDIDIKELESYVKKLKK